MYRASTADNVPERWSRELVRRAAITRPDTSAGLETRLPDQPGRGANQLQSYNALTFCSAKALAHAPTAVIIHAASMGAGKVE
jgi:hypothetical protein